MQCCKHEKQTPFLLRSQPQAAEFGLLNQSCGCKNENLELYDIKNSKQYASQLEEDQVHKWAVSQGYKVEQGSIFSHTFKDVISIT